MAGYELATAYVNLVVETGDAGRRIGGMFKGVEGTAASTGRGAGKKFAQAFSGAKPIDVKNDADKAAAQVDVAANKVRDARAKEEAAARKVIIEEAKLAEQRESGNTKASTILATEDRLARAKDAAALASQRVESAVEQETSAKESSIQANKRLESSQKDTGEAADETGRKFGSLKDRIKAALSGNFKGAFAKIPDDADDAADKVEDRFEDTGTSSAQRFGSGFKRMLGPLLAAISAGAVIKVGFEAGMGLQQSTKTLEGLYGNAKLAKTTVEGLKDVAKTSPIDTVAYTKASESLAYAGVEGKEAIGVLENVGKAITAAGGDSTNMDRATEAILKGVNAGKFQLDTLQQLSDAGIPILSGLAEHFGVSIEEVNKMASAGKVGLEDVMSVMENGTGETFQKAIKSSETASQSLSNQWKMAKDRIAVSLGEAFMPLMNKYAPLVGQAGDKIAGSIEGISGAVKNVTQFFKDWWPVLTPTAVGLTGLGVATWIATGGLTAMGVAIAGVFSAISKGIAAIPVIGWVIAGIGLLVTALIWFFTKTELGQKIWANTWAAIKTAAAAVVDWFSNYVVPLWNTIMSSLGTALSWTGNLFKTIFSAIGTAAMWVWNSVLKPTFNALIAFWNTILAPAIAWVGNLFKTIFTAIGATIKWWWNTVLKPVFSALVAFWKNVIAPVLNWFKNTFQAVFLLIGAIIKYWWNSSVKPVFNSVVSFIKGTLGNAFKWFRDSIIKPVWSWIKAYISTMWLGIKTIFNAIKSFLQGPLASVFKWFRDSIIKPVWNGIKTAISTVWGGIKSIFNAIRTFITGPLSSVFRWFRDSLIKPIWDGIKTKISAVWNKGIKPVFTALGDFIKNNVAPKFKSGVDAISKAWDGLKNAAKKPVKFVINKVINEGIIDRFNSIADKFPGTKHIKHISLPKGFRDGGKVWGAGTETSDSINARLSRNEHVLTAQDVRNLGGHGGVYALRKAASKRSSQAPAFRRGGAVGADGIPGFAKGGSLSDAARWLQTKGAKITEFKAWGQRVGGHAKNSQHYNGTAFDANTRPGQSAGEIADFDRLVPQLLEKFPGLKVLWKVPNHWNHLHVATGKGGRVGTGGPGDGGAGILDSILAPFKKFKDGLGKKFEKYGKFGEIAKGMATKAVTAPIDWISSKADLFGDFVSEKWQGAKNAAAETQVKAAALKYGWNSGPQWSALHTLIGKESGWNQNAANPSSSARGLFQKMTSIHGPIEKTAFGQAGWGLKYIKNTYGSPVKALAKWMSRSPHWYAKGGAVDPTGATPKVYDGGGLLKKGTQLVQHNSSKPDRVLSEAQWDGIYEAARGGGTDGMTIQLTTPVVEKNEVNEWLDSVGFAFNHLGKSRAFSGVNG